MGWLFTYNYNSTKQDLIRARTAVACEGWRGLVRAYHARMSRRFEAGQQIVLLACRIPWARITSVRPLWGEYRGVVYGLRLGELLTEAVP